MSRENTCGVFSTTPNANAGTFRGCPRKAILCGLVTAAIVGLCLPAQAQVVGTWLNLSGGSWSNSANWVGARFRD